MDKVFWLKHKNDDVAVISIDETGAITRVAEKVQRELLPFGTGGDRTKLKKWWRNRAVPISQENIRNYLHEEGISSAEMYLTRNLGLSMTDCYWVKPVESDLTWEKVNLFTNDFTLADKRSGTLVQAGSAAGLFETYGFTPASSVQGELRKKWIIEKGTRYLVKGNYGSSCQQSLNEVFASLLHKRQGWKNYIPYNLCKLKAKLDQTEPVGALGCCSRAFTDENLEFISGYEVCDSRKKDNAVSEYESFIQICVENGLEEETVRTFLEYQIMTDFVITNTDRHLNNFGVLRDSNTLRFVRMAPIFDSGNSMFWRTGFLEIPYEKADFRKIEITSFRSREKELLKYVRNRTLLRTDLLPKCFELEKIYTLDIAREEGRYQKIRKAYEKKIDLMDEFQRTGTIEYERKIIEGLNVIKDNKNRMTEAPSMLRSAHSLSEKKER